MREFEERFIALGLPYKVIGGPRFYERAEIRDALAYLRCVAQPDDDLAFERIYNQPKRGLGEATLAILHEYGRQAGVSLMRAARMLIETEELKARPRQILRDLLAGFDRWRKRSDEIAHEELAQQILEESGYIDMWKAERTPDAAARLDNLKELVRSMGEFPDLGAFLEHVSLVTEVEGAQEGARVSIMTLHGAKGLEFEIVFLPGWEEGLFPHQRSLDDNGRAGLEEERRLAYVGLTRARREAKIYHAANRRVRGLWQISAALAVHRRTARRPRRIRGCCRKSSAYGAYGISRFDAIAGGLGSRYDTPGWRRAEARSRRAEARSRRADESGPIYDGADSGRTLERTGARLGLAGFALSRGLARVSSQVRARQRRRRGRPETDRRFRSRRPQAGDGQLRHCGSVAFALAPAAKHRSRRMRSVSSAAADGRFRPHSPVLRGGNSDDRSGVLPASRQRRTRHIVSPAPPALGRRMARAHPVSAVVVELAREERMVVRPGLTPRLRLALELLLDPLHVPRSTIAG